MFRTIFAVVLAALAAFAAPAMVGAEESVVEVRLGDNGFQTPSHVAFEYTGNWRNWLKFAYLHPARDEELARDEESARRYPWGARVQIPVSMLKPEFRPADPVKPQIAAPAKTETKVPAAVAASPEPKPTFYLPLPSDKEKSVFATFNEKLEAAFAVPVVPATLAGIYVFSHVFILGGLLLLRREARNGNGYSRTRRRPVEVEEDTEIDEAADEDEEDASRMPLVLFEHPTGRRLFKTEEETRADFLRSFGETFSRAIFRQCGVSADTREVRVHEDSEVIIEIGFREVSSTLQYFHKVEACAWDIFRSLPHREAMELSRVESSLLGPNLGVKIYLSYRGGTSRTGIPPARLPAAV